MRPRNVFVWASQIAQTNVWRQDYGFFRAVTEGEAFWKLVWKQSMFLLFCYAQTLLYLTILNTAMHKFNENKAKEPADKTTKCVFSLSSVFCVQTGRIFWVEITVVDGRRNSESQDVTSPSLRGLHECLLKIIKELPFISCSSVEINVAKYECTTARLDPLCARPSLIKLCQPLKYHNN